MKELEGKGVVPVAVRLPGDPWHIPQRPHLRNQ